MRIRNAAKNLEYLGLVGVNCVPYEKVLVSNCQLCSYGDAWVNSSNLEAADSASPNALPKRLNGVSDCSRHLLTNSYSVPLKPPPCLKTRSSRSVTKAATICNGKAFSFRPSGSLTL